MSPAKETLEQMVELLEQRCDKHEALIANLANVYTEMFVAIELIIQTLLEPRDQSEQTEFYRQLRERHLKMMQMINDIGDEMGTQATPDADSTE